MFFIGGGGGLGDNEGGRRRRAEDSLDARKKFSSINIDNLCSSTSYVPDK